MWPFGGTTICAVTAQQVFFWGEKFANSLEFLQFAKKREIMAILLSNDSKLHADGSLLSFQ